MDLLKSAQIGVVADVRKMTRSRTNPQYNADVLSETLARFGIGTNIFRRWADCVREHKTFRRASTGSGKTKAFTIMRITR